MPSSSSRLNTEQETSTSIKQAVKMVQAMKKKQSSSWLDTVKVATLSALANWVGDLLLYPLDTVSTRLKANRQVNQNPIKFLFNSIKTQKFKLYRGIALSFPSSFVPTFIYINMYELMMNKMSDIVDLITIHKQYKLFFPMFISCAAEYICLWPYLPVDIMNHPDYEYSSLFSGLRQIEKKQGFWRLYKSTKLYFVCKTIYTALQFQIFEIVRFVLGPSYLYLILNTLASTAIATTFLNPFEVLLTRYALVDTTKKKLVLSLMVKRIYATEGILGFYKGYVTELLSHCLYALFWMPTYQFCREYYGTNISIQ